MLAITVQSRQVLTLQIDNDKDLKKRCPELVSDLVECSAFVKWRPGCSPPPARILACP